MIAVAAGKRKVLITSLVFASLVQATFAVLIAFCVQRVFDTLLSPQASAERLDGVAMAALFAGAALGGASLELYRSWAGERLGLSYVSEVRASLFDRIMSASPSALSQKGQGALLLPFVGDLTAIKKWVSDGLVRLISAGITSLLLILVLAFRSVELAVAAGLVVIAAALAAVWLSGPLSDAIAENRRRRGAVANFVAGSIRVASTIQAFDRLPRERQRLDRRTEALTSASTELAKLSGLMMAIVHLAATALVGVTLIIGVTQVQSGASSIGLVAAAISIAALLAGAVRDLGISFELWRRAQLAFAKIEAAHAIAPAMATGERDRKLRDAKGGVSLKSVAVKGLLKRFNAEAQVHDVVNIVGESGAGKSTLLAIVARLRDPDGGKVRLNGRDLRRFSLSSVRRHIGVASAATPLMRGTIAMNLRYRAPNASAEEVARVSKICNLDPILDRFTSRDQMRLSEGAPELSQSEVQRLQIARAMIGSPAVLVLDGVDAHLDATTTNRITAALASYDGVVFMTASSPALCNGANRIWRIDGGKVLTEPSPPEALMQSEPALA